MAANDLRIVKTNDLALIERLDAQVFGEDEEYEFKGNHMWVVLTPDGTPVGYATLQVIDRGTAGFLSRCGILPPYRGRGLQKRFVQVRERCARKLGLRTIVTYTSVTNVPSINSLINQGYKTYHPQTYWGFEWGRGIYWIRKL